MLLPRPGRRTLALITILAVGAVLLTACGSESAEQQAAQRERSTDMDLPFTGCDEVKCSGEIGGAAYEILLPEKWNGTLMLYSHGYRQAQAAPPDFEEPSTAAEPAPGWSSGQRDVGEQLLAEGYAIAGSSYASNGWAVGDGVQAGEQLRDFFVENIGEPDRTYVWGDSLGGLVTQVLAEKHPEWVSGAAPLCGVLAGPVLNLDLALDVAYSVKSLIYPELKLSGFSSWEEAVQNWEGAYAAIVSAGSETTDGVPAVLLTAALADAPSRTKTYDGSTLESQVRAMAESVVTAIGYATFGRFDIEQRVGGNPSGNDGIDYATRVSESERQLIETVSPGATDRLLAELAAGERLVADEDAREAFAQTGTPAGAVQDPTVTLHTVADPLVLVQNQTVFDEKANSNPQRTDDFVQLYVVPPATYPEDPGAPYGGGHCNFSVEQRMGVVSLLDDWVRTGIYPGPEAVSAAFPSGGVDPSYQPGPWPAATDG